MGRWPTKEQMAKRRRRVVELRAQGLSHAEIAERLGITRGTSEHDYKRYKEEEKNGKKNHKRH